RAQPGFRRKPPHPRCGVVPAPPSRFAEHTPSIPRDLRPAGEPHGLPRRPPLPPARQSPTPDFPPIAHGYTAPNPPRRAGATEWLVAVPASSPISCAAPESDHNRFAKPSFPPPRVFGHHRCSGGLFTLF